MICNRCGQESTDDTLCLHGTKHPVPTERFDAGYSVRGVHVGTSPTIEPPKPRPPRKPKEWPLLIRGIAKRKIDSDKGVGDTIKRIISNVGGDQFEWVMKRLNIDCGCGSRQAWLNARYPY